MLLSFNVVSTTGVMKLFKFYLLVQNVCKSQLRTQTFNWYVHIGNRQKISKLVFYAILFLVIFIWNETKLQLSLSHSCFFSCIKFFLAFDDDV